MDQGENIFNKVSSLWPIVCNCSRDFLIRNLPLLMENDTISKYSFEKGEWKEKEFSLKNIKNPDELAKSCLSPMMQKNFTTIEDCQDVYNLCTIIPRLFKGPEANAAVHVTRKRNDWAHSNSGAPHWRDENVLQDNLRSVRALVRGICTEQKRAEIYEQIANVEQRKYFTEKEVKSFEDDREKAFDLLKKIMDEYTKNINDHAKVLKNAICESSADVKAFVDDKLEAVVGSQQRESLQTTTHLSGDHNTNYGGNIVGGDLV